MNRWHEMQIESYRRWLDERPMLQRIEFPLTWSSGGSSFSGPITCVWR